jgi:hypothetical protein
MFNFKVEVKNSCYVNYGLGLFAKEFIKKIQLYGNLKTE